MPGYAKRGSTQVCVCRLDFNHTKRGKCFPFILGLPIQLCTSRLKWIRESRVERKETHKNNFKIYVDFITNIR